MSPSTRIIVNTIAQFFKSMLSVIFAFVSTRYVLESLGVEDFGLYNLIAGIVSMLSFIMTAMSSSTQRFLSYSQGLGDTKEVKALFNNSFVLHISFGLCIFICLEGCTTFVFDSLLNIDTERLDTAIKIYHIILLTLLVTFATSPFKAAIVAHENIVFSSLVEVFDSLFKLVIAFSLRYVPFDLLQYYVLMLFVMQLLNFLIYGGYALIKYEECTWRVYVGLTTKRILKLLSFTGWNIYNISCVVGRMQGISILLNRAMGTTINAAYGLGFQISSAVNYLSSSLANAINPQLMKAEGAGDRQKMLRLAELESKFAFLIFATISIPLMFEMQLVLDFWLNEVPKYSVLFCRMVLLAALADTLTLGLGPANQAIGRIGWYTLTVYSIKLLTLPVAFLLLINDADLLWVAIAYVGFEFISSLIRLPFLSYCANLSISHFVRNVFVRELLPVFGMVITCLLQHLFIDSPFRLFTTFIFSFIVSILLIYYTSLTKQERSGLILIINKFLKIKKS